MDSGLAGLLGAVIGATAAFAAQWTAYRWARADDRRREQVELVARFWQAVDTMWRKANGLEYVILSLTSAQQAGHWDSVREMENRRQTTIREQTEATTEARFLVAQLRLLYPALAEPADALRAASENYDHQQRHEQRTARQNALGAFEQAARAAITND